jgi:hypothetical protein
MENVPDYVTFHLVWRTYLLNSYAVYNGCDSRIAPRPNCASGARGPFRFAQEDIYRQVTVIFRSLKRTNLGQEAVIFRSLKEFVLDIALLAEKERLGGKLAEDQLFFRFRS